ncbi:hypothetical protein Q3G72_024612 [Acer saccharum]|nr:hypothetical protein Q3G72_024612 [Acer saccharum]
MEIDEGATDDCDGVPFIRQVQNGQGVISRPIAESGKDQSGSCSKDKVMPRIGISMATGGSLSPVIPFSTSGEQRM